MTPYLSAFSDDLHSEFAPAAMAARARGLDGIAIRNVSGVNVVELDEPSVTGIRKTSDAHGLRISCLGSQFGRGLYLDDEELRPAAMRLLEQAFVRAEILGTTSVRVFAPWLHGQEELPEWSRRPDLTAALPAVTDLLSPAVRLAERAGMTLMFELEGASYVGTVAEASALFASLDSDAVALCWDVCNAWWSGEQALDALDLALSLPVVDAQTKDALPRADDPSRPTFDRAIAGEGGVGYRTLIPALVAAGYDGWITIERVHHPLRPEDYPDLQRSTLADIDSIREILAHSKRNAGDE